MRLMNIAALFIAIGSAFLLYGLNYDTRQLEGNVQAQERAAATAKNDIAILRAERSHLSRPARIDPFARQIGLAPPRPDQMTTASELATSSIDRQGK